MLSAKNLAASLVSVKTSAQEGATVKIVASPKLNSASFSTWSPGLNQATLQSVTLVFDAPQNGGDK